MDPVKLLVLGDTHFARRNQELGEEITKIFDEVDYIVHAGDFTHKSLVDFLESTGKFVGVAGNMDPMTIKKHLPEVNEIDLGEIKIGIIHGWGAPHDIVERIHPISKKHGFDIVIFGHTHNHLEMEFEGIKYYNSGSPVDKMFAKENTFLILTIHSRERVEAKFIKV
ncbi:MAG: metallophosphoesterase family protein [Candidatus Hodarchaeota archaeon]